MYQGTFGEPYPRCRFARHTPTKFVYSHVTGLWLLWFPPPRHSVDLHVYGRDVVFDSADPCQRWKMPAHEETLLGRKIFRQPRFIDSSSPALLAPDMSIKRIASCPVLKDRGRGGRHRRQTNADHVKTLPAVRNLEYRNIYMRPRNE